MNQPSNAYLGARILIVDDEQANVLLLERMLVRAGYRLVTSTTDSRQAEQLFQETHPDLVLLDIGLPGMDGYAVAERLRAAGHRTVGLGDVAAQVRHGLELPPAAVVLSSTMAIAACTNTPSQCFRRTA